MDSYLLIYFAVICFLFVFTKIFFTPIKKILKLFLNSAFGGIVIFLINSIGNLWGFHIGLNFVTSALIGLLGIPGTLCLIVVKTLFIQQ